MRHRRAAATDSLPAFRWALFGCAMFSFCGSIFAALAVKDADAAPSRGLAPTERVLAAD